LSLTAQAGATIALFAALAFPCNAVANGADLPPEVALQGFAKAEDGRLRLLVRMPLDLLVGFGLPKRGPGYLDLARIDERLQHAAAAAGRQIELREDGILLVPTTRQARISLLSDRSFGSYASAAAHLRGARLPESTDLFWNQGFFDTELDYALRSSTPALSIRLKVAPELGRRLKLQLEFLPANEPVRRLTLVGDWGWIALAPRWHEAAWLFANQGFAGAFSFERLVFLLCLIAPFRQFRGVLALFLVFSGLQAFTLTAAALVEIRGIRWLISLFDAGLAAAILLLAIGNLAAPSVRARWVIGAILGALGGFGLGRLLDDAGQFAGTHPVVSAGSFNIGVAAGEVVSFALAFSLMRLIFARLLPPSLAVVVVSAVLGHLGWHWMIDRFHPLGHELEHASTSGLSSALWLLPALVAGALGWFLPRRLGGEPVPSLLGALLERDKTPTRD
jgi:hypothetical protein